MNVDSALLILKINDKCVEATLERIRFPVALLALDNWVPDCGMFLFMCVGAAWEISSVGIELEPLGVLSITPVGSTYRLQHQLVFNWHSVHDSRLLPSHLG